MGFYRPARPAPECSGASRGGARAAGATGRGRSAAADTSFAVREHPHRVALAAPGLAWGPVLGVAAAVTAVLVATSGRYGPHRDELYFVASGRRLAWGYPDQPPLTPLLARAMDELATGSLVALRLPAALAIGTLVVLTALTARALGAGRVGQVLAAACPAVATVFLVSGHLLSTTTIDLLMWTAITLLLVLVLRGADPRLWVAAGAVAGVGLLNKQLVAFLLAAVGVGLLCVGPREVLRTIWPWAGAAVALALWAPHLLWQARAGWPAFEVASAVAAGGSTSSEPPELFLPFQLVLVSALLVPVWVVGLVRLWRDQRLRALALAYPLLAAVFLLTGGKPYYLAGLYPLLLAAGAQPTVDWARRRRSRTSLLVAGLALSGATSAVIALPVLPVRDAGPVIALNEDAGETVGWPAFVRTVANVHTGEAVVLTQNYGQAGAIDRYGPKLGLPAAYSGHNGYALWGPPPERDVPVVAVGIPRDNLDRWFRRCKLAARIDNRVGIANEEQGAPLHVCNERRKTWAALWPQISHLG
jgi:4-amino-4-deoxy-L-arabinose transferase-like glycosyltransferase